jgi:hypothetical protein
MTATTAAPLKTLAQQIARQQAELETLHLDYEARQTRLADLTRRKDELTAQLQQVEADIQATTQGRSSSTPSRTPAAASQPQRKTPPVQPTGSSPPPTRVRKHSLAAVLVNIVRKADGPVTVKQLTEEMVRRKFPTTSSNLARMIDTRVRGLVKRGLLQRASGRAGVILATSATGSEASADHAKPGHKTSGKNGVVVAKATSAAKPDGQSQRVPLRPLLARLLAKSRRLLAARELAEQVLASGYKTKSKNFVDVLWVALGQMPNVENVPGQGYRLKK